MLATNRSIAIATNTNPICGDLIFACSIMQLAMGFHSSQQTPRCPLSFEARFNFICKSRATRGSEPTSLSFNNLVPRAFALKNGRLWGGALRDDTKSGCVADYYLVTSAEYFLPNCVVWSQANGELACRL